MTIHLNMKCACWTIQQREHVKSLGASVQAGTETVQSLNGTAPCTLVRGLNLLDALARTTGSAILILASRPSGSLGS